MLFKHFQLNTFFFLTFVKTLSSTKYIVIFLYNCIQMPTFWSKHFFPKSILIIIAKQFSVIAFIKTFLGQWRLISPPTYLGDRVADSLHFLRCNGLNVNFGHYLCMEKPPRAIGVGCRGHRVRPTLLETHTFNNCIGKRSSHLS